MLAMMDDARKKLRTHVGQFRVLKMLPRTLTNPPRPSIY
ncbi:unnamed protein product [Amoebophrya sp. A25]|nr:unnamed protein product [Amoebophrya sp. A25]|eukprot:GSA25T00018993001.1